MSEARDLGDLAGDDARVVLLHDIRDVFAAAFPDDHLAHTGESAGPGRPDEGPRLTTKQMLERLCSIEERPWGAWERARKPMTDMGLAALLRPYGIRFDRMGHRKASRET